MCLAGSGATQGGRECLHGVLAADFDQRVLAAHRSGFGLAFDRSRVGDLRPIAVDEGAVLFHRLDGRARFAQLGEFQLDFLFGNLGGRLRNGDILVAFDGESWE